MRDDVATDAGRARRAEGRRRQAVLAGHLGDADAARRALEDADPSVRAAGLGALARLGALLAADVVDALRTGPVAVRRRAAAVADRARGRGSRSTLPALMTATLADADPLVAVEAAWFLGERRHRAAVSALVAMARDHGDPRCREAAVAALGAIGDVAGLDAVLAAARHDKPAVRRRAVVALAGFEDPRVDPALRDAAADRDWQVRQAAAELLDDEQS